MDLLKIIDSLLLWMEKKLNKSAPTILAHEIENYFASSFRILTNNKVVDATPSAYQKYLENFRQSIKKISYDVEEKIESDQKAIYVFTIHIEKEKKISLKVISIFSFDHQNKITQWREIFCSLDESTLFY